MRIGIDATALPKHLAGAGRYILNLIVYLAKTDTFNEYFVFTKRADKALFGDLPANFNTIICPDFHHLPRTVWQLMRPPHHAESHRLDLWHAPHYTAPYKLKNTSLVVTIHDLTFYLFPEFYSLTRRQSFKQFIRHAAYKADGLICVSKSTKSDLLLLFPDAENRTFVVHSGIESRFENDTYVTPTATSPKTCDDKPFVLFVGTLERRKNVTMLLTAFARLIADEKHPHHLILAGQPDNDSENIHKRISQLGISNRVHLLGYVHENELISLYKRADLFVLPSYYEGFGFPVIEAMACGTPVLCANVGATAELAGHRSMLFRTGSVEDLYCKMARILVDSETRQQAVRYGIGRAREFNWEKTANETIAIYEETVSLKKSKKFIFDLKPGKPVANTAFSITESILRTIVFSDLFEFPLKMKEIYRDLPDTAATFDEFKTALDGQDMPALISQRKGYYFLQGRDELVDMRKQKSKKTQNLMAKHEKVLRAITNFPFVRAVSLSGTAAFENVNGKDDIDLFILVNGFRTWTTYLLLVLFLKIIRKRDVICINCMDGSTEAAGIEKNFFVAHQIAHLQPISGNGAFDHYWQSNNWILKHLPQAQAKSPLKGYDSGSKKIKRWLERALSMPFFDRAENTIFSLYSNRIQRLASQKQNGKIYIDANQIQLFTNDHQERIMMEFDQRLKQLGLRPWLANHPEQNQENLLVGKV